MTKSSPGRVIRKGARKTASQHTEADGFGLVATTAGPGAEIPLEKLGHPGSLTELHVVPQFAGESPGDSARLRDTGVRRFEALAILSKTPTPTLALDFRGDPDAGGSYFLFGPEALVVDTPWGRVGISKNDKGEASLVVMHCDARSPGEAIEQLELACSSFLDHWAYEATAPVYITRAQASDVANGVQMARFSTPFRSSTVNTLAATIPTSLRPVLALYREGIGSASALYKLLCFYKILEGYFGRLKPDLAKIFRAADLTYPEPSNRVPDHPDLEPLCKAYVGKSITKLKDELLTPRFRDVVAHFEKDGSSPLISTNPTDIVRFNQAALVAELCAREVVESYKRAFNAAMSAGLDLNSYGAG